MKIIINDDINMIIFLNKEYLTINIDDSDNLENCFKELFLILKDIYDIKINGYYSIDVYVDSYYGAVLELVKEELEYIDYYDNQVDMRITIHDSNFVYKFEDYFLARKLNLNLYLYKNEVYGKINGLENNAQMGRIIENSEVLYKDTDKILKYGNRIEV